MRLADFFIGKPGPGSISEALAMKLPVIVERNAWTLPQERYNADWVVEKQVGLVLRNFRQIVPAVAELLQPEIYRRFRAQGSGAENRAVFEIPDILEKILKSCELTLSSLTAASLCAEDQFLDWMNHIAQQQLDRREAAVKPCRGRNRPRPRKREVARENSGADRRPAGLHGSAERACYGTHRAARYVIENVIFESLPRILRHRESLPSAAARVAIPEFSSARSLG